MYLELIAKHFECGESCKLRIINVVQVWVTDNFKSVLSLRSTVL